MKRVMIRYKVKADRVAENEAFIVKVFEQLKSEQPAGLRYGSFKLSDGQSFVHIVSIETADGTNPLLEMAAFKAFTEKVKDRCEEPPVTMEMTEIGSYNFLGE